MKKSSNITAIVALSLAVAGVVKAGLLGVNVTPPTIVYANTGSSATSYNSGSQIFTVITTPSTIKFTATEPTFSILAPRSMKISIQVDNTGALVGGVAGPDLVISGRVQRIVGTVTNTYIGLLLTGEVTAFGSQDSGTTVDNYDFRFTPTGGLLLPFFQCDHIGVTLVSEVSTFTGLFTTNFNGQSKGNVGLEDQVPPTITCPFDNLNVTNVECSAQAGQNGAYVTFPNPVASDNCDTNVLITCAPTNGSFFALSPGTNMTSTLVTCVAQDASGNTNSCSFTVTVIDDLPPEFDSNPVLDPCQAEPLVLSTDPGTCSATLTFPKPSAMDSCCTSSVPVSVSAIDEHGFIITLTEYTSNDIVYVTGQFPQTCCRSNVITSTANDGRGNSAQQQCFLYVYDTEPPMLECPSNQTVSCTNGPIFYPDPMFSDNCTNLTVSCTPSNGTFLGIGSYTVTCTAVDGCGHNTNTCNFTLDVVDATPPEITCPTNLTVECGQPTDPGNTGTATATDDCDANPTVSFADSASGVCPSVIYRTWKAIDHSGNSNECTQVISVNDTTPPGITCPADKQLQCGASTATNNTGAATGSDSCSGVTITYIDSPAATNCTGQAGIDRAWTVTDGCSNAVSCVQHITFVDTTAPVISCPSDKQLQCGASTATNNTGSATASSDNCGGEVTITYTDAATPANCTGQAGIDRTWKAMDSCGNFDTCVQHITFVDTTAPVVSCPSDKQLQCGASTATNNTGRATASSDNCGGPVTITYTDAATPANCTGQAGIDRTWKAMDSCGNFDTCVQHITFVDTTAPTVNCPADKQLQCGESTATNNTGRATASSDNCGGAVTITYTDAATPANCTGQAGIDRTWKAMDSCGNFDTCVQHITFVDTTAPIVTVPAGGNLGCNPSPLPTDASVKALVTATDNCSTTTVTVTHVDTTVSCTTTSTFTVVVKDACTNTTTKTVVYTYGCPPCVPFSFNFVGNTALSGAVANVRTFVTNGVSVKVTAFSRTTGGTWAKAYLGSYAGGLGVTDSSEGSGSSNRHTVDNIDRNNYVLFEFSQPVTLDRAYLGYVVTDSDLTLWIGTFTDPYNNHLNLSDAVLSSFGFTENNDTTTNATRWADLNAGSVMGNAIVIAARTGTTTTNDQFKIEKFDVCKQQCTVMTLGCATSSGTKGVAYSSALVRSGGTSPFTYSIYSGSLPPGLTLNASTGAITGTPTTAGTYTYTGKVTDSTGATAYTAGCTITISNPCSSSFCGSILRDCNADANLSGEAGISNVTLTLKNASGAVVATTISSANGSYCFSALNSGTYTLVVTPPANYVLTAPAGCNNQLTGFLPACTNFTGINFGYRGNAPAISLTKTGVKTSTTVITYTFTVKNTGNTCFYGGMHVDDPMLGGQIFYQSPVSPGQSYTFTKTYTIKASDPTYIANTATATGHPPTGSAVTKTASCSVHK